MPLAPRPSSSRDKGGSKSSVKSATGKAAQRARSGTNLGSSGQAKKLSNYPSLDWDTVADDVEHVTDLAMKITQAQLGANGYFLLSAALPVAYAHAGIDAHLASNDGMLYVRFYKVSVDKFLQAMMDDEDNMESDDGEE